MNPGHRQKAQIMDATMIPGLYDLTALLCFSGRNQFWNQLCLSFIKQNSIAN
jgi:hypothetical protein